MLSHKQLLIDQNHLFFTSSNVTWGIPVSLPVIEETPTLPLEIYGKSKIQAEKEIEKFINRINIQIFRCPVITGIGRLGFKLFYMNLSLKIKMFICLVMGLININL